MDTSFFFRILVIAFFCHGAARAEEAPPVDPNVARLNADTARLQAETALLTAQAANATARFGAAATVKEGTITNPGNFSAMGHWTLSAATDSATTKITGEIAQSLKDSCAGVDILVTSVEDRRASAVHASIVGERLDGFTRELEKALSAAEPPGVRRMEGLAAVSSIRGLVGTIDSLVGLLRADYAFADLAAAANDMSLRIEVAEALNASLSQRVLIDGLASPGRTNALISKHITFSNARQGAQGRYVVAFANAGSDAEKAKLAGVKALLDAAATLDSVLTTPASGQVPLVQLALASESSGKDICAVYVKFASYSASIVTRKRLLSRNDTVAAIAGGSVQLAVFDKMGHMLLADVISVDERISGKLSEIMDNAKPFGKWRPDAVITGQTP